MSLESNVVMAHLCRLYYVRDLTQQQIAERVGMSRFKVARLLDQARAEGIVQFEIQELVAVDDALSRGLEDAFELSLAVVVRAGGDVGAIARAAAAWLPDMVHDGEPVGVAWGTTLQRIVALLPHRDRAAGPIVQICGAIPGLEPGTGPIELALRFAERLGGPVYSLPAPALPNRAVRDGLLADAAVRPTVDLFDRVEFALVGIGAGSNLPDAPDHAAGHLLVHVFDEQGRFLESEAADRAVALSLEQLQRPRVVAVAGGEGKERAILGALRTGVIDVLITDAECARFALEAAVAGPEKTDPAGAVQTGVPR
jgi:DNA-binding transcriptional regulator LsrR (DeoR family)